MKFGLVLRQVTRGTIFVLRKLWFVDFEKAFAYVRRDFVRWPFKRLGVEEWLVKIG